MAARSVWKGNLSIGLVTVGVAAYKAVDDPASATSMRRLHTTCQQPLNEQRVCTHCNVVNVPMTDVVSGVEQPDKTFITLAASEVDALKTPSTHLIAVEAFVREADIEPLGIDRTYYLAPDSAASASSFALMRDAMRDKGRVLTGRLTIYGREHAVAVRPLGRVLALQLLHAQALVREPSSLPFYSDLATPVDPKQAVLAGQLIDLYAGDFDKTAYEDQYVAAFKALVESKRTGLPQVSVPAAPVAAPVVDLMAALAASLAAKVPAPAKKALLATVPSATPLKVKAPRKVKVAA